MVLLQLVLTAAE